MIIILFEYNDEVITTLAIDEKQQQHLILLILLILYIINIINKCS